MNGFNKTLCQNLDLVEHCVKEKLFQFFANGPANIHGSHLPLLKIAKKYEIDDKYVINYQMDFNQIYQTNAFNEFFS